MQKVLIIGYRGLKVKVSFRGNHGENYQAQQILGFFCRCIALTPRRLREPTSKSRHYVVLRGAL